MIDLISEGVGGEVVSCNDEFFAEAANLLKVADPITNGDYTDRGKWMDGWETRRRREPGHDWCVIRLGIPGSIVRVVVDTSHFTGNYPERFSLDACGVDDPDTADWIEIIPVTDLEGDTVADFEVDHPHRVTMVRLNIYPDGGVARLRVEGHPIPAMKLVCPDGPTDLAAAAVGGEVIAASDMHFSHPGHLLRPVPSAGMWDGWETKRRRDDGYDWVTVRLGMTGIVEGLIVDTTHFKGNAPGWVSVELSTDETEWFMAADHVPVRADHVNELHLSSPRRASMVRVSIHPDGGVARLRVLGHVDHSSAASRRLAYLNSLYDQAAHGFFATACQAERWVSGMIGLRPFQSVGSVLAGSEECFDSLGEADWLEAFAGHPRIGEKGDGMAGHEQSGVDLATVGELDQVNREYEERFGFTFIVYATGKTGEAMLDIARERLGNDRGVEVVNAATEQRRITETRLRRMLCQEIS